MEINALMMDTTDNVVTCVTEVPAGSQAVFTSSNTVKAWARYRKIFRQVAG